MNPARKRTMRLAIALSAAVVLASALIYTSFSAADPAFTPSQLVRDAQAGRTYQLSGVVAWQQRTGSGVDFGVRDRAAKGGPDVTVAYTGEVPDPFRVGREIIVTVSSGGSGGSYVGQRNSLVTKCPSKYTDAPAGQ